MIWAQITMFNNIKPNSNCFSGLLNIFLALYSTLTIILNPQKKTFLVLATAVMLRVCWVGLYEVGPTNMAIPDQYFTSLWLSSVGYHHMRNRIPIVKIKVYRVQNALNPISVESRHLHETPAAENVMRCGVAYEIL